MDDNKLLATRDGWGDGLVELAKKDKRIVVLTADVKESTRVERFSEIYPDRFIECGVAEQNMMGIAAGLAAAGKIPFIASYAVFSPGRNWDQMRVSVCYSNLKVIIGGAHTGLTVGPDGATHQALEDIALTRVLPNMKVVAPCDYWEAFKAVHEAANANSPVYIRLTREKTPEITSKDAEFKIGKAEIVWNSEFLKEKVTNEVVVIGCGPILNEVLTAAKELNEDGIGTIVINNHTIKPMDRETILNAVRKCNAVVTVEEHQEAGGMGSAVCEMLAGEWPVPVEMVAVKDSFGESGTPEELAEKYGLKAINIVRAVKKVIERKEQPSI